MSFRVSLNPWGIANVRSPTINEFAEKYIVSCLSLFAHWLYPVLQVSLDSQHKPLFDLEFGELCNYVTMLHVNTIMSTKKNCHVPRSCESLRRYATNFSGLACPILDMQNMGKSSEITRCPNRCLPHAGDKLPQLPVWAKGLETTDINWQSSAQRGGKAIMVWLLKVPTTHELLVPRTEIEAMTSDLWFPMVSPRKFLGAAPCLAWQLINETPWIYGFRSIDQNCGPIMTLREEFKEAKHLNRCGNIKSTAWHHFYLSVCFHHSSWASTKFCQTWLSKCRRPLSPLHAPKFPLKWPKMEDQQICADDTWQLASCLAGSAATVRSPRLSLQQGNGISSPSGCLKHLTILWFWNIRQQRLLQLRLKRVRLSQGAERNWNDAGLGRPCCGPLHQLPSTLRWAASHSPRDTGESFVLTVRSMTRKQDLNWQIVATLSWHFSTKLFGCLHQ